LNQLLLDCAEAEKERCARHVTAISMRKTLMIHWKRETSILKQQITKRGATQSHEGRRFCIREVIHVSGRKENLSNTSFWGINFPVRQSTEGNIKNVRKKRAYD